MTIRSVLGGSDEPVDETGLRDLALDRVAARVRRACRGRSPAPLLQRPLRDPAAVRARQDVFRDLDDPAVHAAVVAFTAAMRGTRRGLAVCARTPPGPATDRRRLDMVLAHDAAVRALAHDLAAAAPASRRLRAVVADLGEYLVTAPVRERRDRSTRLRERLAAFRFDLSIHDDTITVAAASAVPDHAERLRAVLGPLLPPELPQPSGEPLDDGLNPLELAVLDQVVRLDPALFAELAAVPGDPDGLVDPELDRLDHELSCCLGYLEVLAPLRAAGMPVCLPEVGDTDLDARDAYDLALALTLVERDASPVTNDITLTGDERVVVVTGPNQGGKTTLARTFGQLHHLAALGCPVPGSAVRCPLSDRVLTHFEQAESLATRDGKLAEELHRLRDLLAAATADSVLVLNEIFTSTTLADARELSTAVLDTIAGLGVRCLWVTFVDEVATGRPGVVSMVADATRTFRVVRAPADTRGHARALAERHGVSAEQLARRVLR